MSTRQSLGVPRHHRPAPALAQALRDAKLSNAQLVDENARLARRMLDAELKNLLLKEQVALLQERLAQRIQAVEIPSLVGSGA